MPKLICDNCNKAIDEGVHPYTMKIELFPRVEESLEGLVSSADEIDFDKELREIVEQLESMNADERAAEESRIYTSVQYVLCSPCRDSFARRLKRNIASS